MLETRKDPVERVDGVEDSGAAMWRTHGGISSCDV